MDQPLNRQTRRLIAKHTPSPGQTRMMLDTTKILKDWQGNPVMNTTSEKKERKDKPLALADFLAGHLGQGQTLPKEKRLRAGILAVRIEQAYGARQRPVPLSDKDVEMILELVDGLPGMPAFLVTAIHYFLAPEEMDQEERETLAFFDLPPVMSDGNGTDQHQNT